MARFEFSGADSLGFKPKGEASQCGRSLSSGSSAFAASKKHLEKSEHYTFGDTDLAAERLRLLARMYEPSSGALLESVAAAEPCRLALDLGCGPGHTTRLVAERTRALQVIGIDQSERAISRALQGAFAGD